MTKYIFIFSTIFISGCGNPVDSESDKGQNKSFYFNDTSIILESGTQNLEIFFDSAGNLEIIKSKIKDTVRNTFFNSHGSVIQVQKIVAGKEDFTSYCFPSGQLSKLKQFNNEDKGMNDNFLWFAPSSSNKLVLDYDKSFMTSIKGLQDTFLINKNYILEVSDIFQLSKTTKVKFTEITYDSDNLTVTYKDEVGLLNISSKKPGTFRLTGDINFITEDDGILRSPLDIDLLFK